MERFQRDSRRIPQIIGEFIHQLFVIAFREEEYELIAPAAWRKRFGGVHRVASQMILHWIGHWAHESGLQDDIAYFYETGDEEEASVADAYMKMWLHKPFREQARMAAKPKGVEKGKVRGLEVADFTAWHWNKYAVDSMATRPPRPLRKDIQALINALELKGEQIRVVIMTGEPFRKFLIDQGCTEVVRRVAEPSD